MLITTNFFTYTLGQTALLAYYTKDGNCYPAKRVAAGIEPKHTLTDGWIYCQVFIFYGNFFGQMLFILTQSIFGITTFKEKCGFSL